ncbi:MAG: DUF177 domain-containing protein [Pseudomonadota bacterium]
MTTRKTLQIAVNSIPEVGKDLNPDLGKEWFARWHQEDPSLEFAEAVITGTVHLARHGRDILVRGHLAGQLGLHCGRCLEGFADPVAADFDLLLAPGPQSQGPAEEELSAAELDRDFYTGEVVDLETILREQIILMLPLKPLCAETCQGLCSRCGANLNREACNCQEEQADSPLAQLAKRKG